MAKKKTVKKVEDKELTMSQKGSSNTTTNIVAPIDEDQLSEEFKESINNIEQSDIKGIMDDPNKGVVCGPSADNPPALEIDVQPEQQIPASTEELDLNPNIPSEDELEVAEPLSDEAVIMMYAQLQESHEALVERQYIIEWKVFGEEYKGKYWYLQVDKEAFIFGTNPADVKFLRAANVKEAYVKFTGTEN